MTFLSQLQPNNSWPSGRCPPTGNSSLGIFPGALLHGRDLGDRTDFDDRTVIKTGALFGDLNCFLLIRDSKKEIPGDRFLRFRKRPVSDRALFSGNNFAFVFQRMTASAFSFCLQPFEPGHPVRHYFLMLCRRKSPVPHIAAEKQQIIGFICCAHNSKTRGMVKSLNRLIAKSVSAYSAG